jgi:hypothetical protein
MKNWKDRIYEFWNGHPRLVHEEVEIICNTRESPRYKHFNDAIICELIDLKIASMHYEKFPDAKRLGLFRRFKNY